MQCLRLVIQNILIQFLFIQNLEITLFILMELLNVLQATGVRVGWSFGPTKVIDRMKALLTHVGAWAPKPEQQAVAEFLDNTPAVNRICE